VYPRLSPDPSRRLARPQRLLRGRVCHPQPRRPHLHLFARGPRRVWNRGPRAMTHTSPRTSARAIFICLYHLPRHLYTPRTRISLIYHTPSRERGGRSPPIQSSRARGALASQIQSVKFIADSQSRYNCEPVRAVVASIANVVAAMFPSLSPIRLARHRSSQLRGL
jgi:hypothetical protein